MYNILMSLIYIYDIKYIPRYDYGYDELTHYSYKGSVRSLLGAVRGRL